MSEAESIKKAKLKWDNARRKLEQQTGKEYTNPYAKKPEKGQDPGAAKKPPPDQDPSAAKTPPRRTPSFAQAVANGTQVAPIFQQAARRPSTSQRDRKHVIFGKIKIKVALPHTFTKLRNTAVRVGEIGLRADPRFCFQAYDDSKDPDLPKISIKADIPTEPGLIRKYFNGLKASRNNKNDRKDNDVVWFDVKIGLSEERAIALEDFKTLLYNEEGDFYPAKQQLPFTKETHMLLRSHESMNPAEHEGLLTEAMIEVSTNEGRGPRTIPFALAVWRSGGRQQEK